MLGAYGLAGLIMVGIFFKRRTRTLLIWSMVLTGLLTLSMLSAIVGSVFAARGPANEQVASFLAVPRSPARRTTWSRSSLG